MATADDNDDHRLTCCELSANAHFPTHLPSPELLRMHRSAQGWMIAFVGLLAGLPPAILSADESLPFSRVESLFQKHCYSCHGMEKPKGELRIDKLDPDIVKGSDRDRWIEVMDRLKFGDMPPESALALKREDRELMLAWIAQGRHQSELVKRE